MSKKSSKPHPGSGIPAKPAPGDFGVPESDVTERNYTSENTKRADPGAALSSPDSAGTRTSGVGGHDSGPGSSSGGDLDPDLIGFGNGEELGGIAASGNIHDPPGPDDADTGREHSTKGA